MMRRRRRRKASWSYADAGSLVLTGGGGLTNYAWVIPPARAQFIMDTKQRNSLTFAGAHLWLDFYWSNKGTATGLADVDFAMFKTTIADPTSFAPDISMADGQWDQPATPAALTSWDEDDDDGTESFMWQHHIKGMTPPNAVVATKDFGTASGAWNGHTANQAVLMPDGSTDAALFVCRKFCVTQEWQPDVVIRSKRRLQKGEGVILTMTWAGSGSANMQAICNYHLRTLTS